MWSLLSRANLLLLSRALEHSEILFPTLSFIFHASPLCVSNLPRELTVAALFSIHLSLYSTHSRPLHGGAEIHLYRLQPRAHVVSAEVAPYQCLISFCKKNPALQTLFHFPITFFRRISLLSTLTRKKAILKKPDMWNRNPKGPQPYTFFSFFSNPAFFHTSRQSSTKMNISKAPWHSLLNC